MPYTVFRYSGLEGWASTLLRSRFTVTDRAFSSTNSAPPVHTPSTSAARGKYRKKWLRAKLPVSFQFHHTQMDGVPAAEFLERLQREIKEI